jgi:hypothetical protein
MAEGPIKFIIFYLAFFLTIAYLGSQISATAIGVSGADVSVVPTLDEDNLTILSYLAFGFNLIIYFLGLQGLAVIGIPAGIAAIIGVVLDIVMLYVIVRLARGGG